MPDHLAPLFRRVLSGAFLLLAHTAVAAEFFVSLKGRDSNPGSASRPFATLERAREAVRTLKASGELNASESTAVTLRGGVYLRSNTFELTAADSGTADRPVVYRAHAGETVRLIGGQRLNAGWFKHVKRDSPAWEQLAPEARGKVVALSLRDRGIQDFGRLVTRGMQLSKQGALGLFANGVALPIAQWPDLAEGAHRAMERGFALIESVAGPTSFVAPGDRLARWSKADQVWLHGYWGNAWADFHIAARDIDASTRTITIAEEPRYPILPRQPFRVYNLLEEITQPGEWFLDRNTGVLYVWPTTDWETAELLVSTLPTELIALRGAEHVVIEGLSLELGWGRLLTIEGGRHNVVGRCAILHAGADAVAISGTDNGLVECVVADAGDRAVRLSGGSRPELTPGGNFVRDSRIVRFARWSWTYAPGIDISGVGQIVANNEIADAPHSAILYSGNNHLIELNDVHQVCRFSSDAGAIYGGRNWGYRGTVIRHNFIHDIHSELEGYGTHGVYLDDLLSGNRVYGNVFYRVSGHAIQSGGGRDNVMENNVVAYCGDALANDARGPKSVNNDPGHKWNLLERLADGGVDYRSKVWAEAYPQLAAMPDNWTELSAPGARWRLPEGGVFSRNIGYRNKVFVKWTDEGTGCRLSDVLTMENNIEDEDPRFVDEARLNLALRDDSPAFGIPGFEQIPFERIGPGNSRVLR